MSEAAGGPESPAEPAAAVEIARAALRGAIAAMAMTGMRTFAGNAGLIDQAPPQAIMRERVWGLLKPVARRRRRSVEELFHWGYGAGGGVMFGLLPTELRRTAWAGPAYGLLLWVGFEAGIAPALGLSHSKEPRPVERAALAADHLLYGLVLSEFRPRPQE